MEKLARQNVFVLLEQVLELWLSELEAALPARFGQHFGKRRWLIADKNGGYKLEHGWKLRPVAIPVEANKVLLRCIELPLISRWQLAKLIQFEMLQHVPLPLEQVLTDFRIIGRNPETGRMLVELAIIRRETVLEVLSAARSLDFEPDAFAIPSNHGIWYAVRPLKIRWLDLWRRGRFQRWATKLLIPTILLLLLVFASQNWSERFAASRQTELLIMQQRAAPIGLLRQRLITVDNKLDYLAQVSSRPSAAAVTEEVARVLPDDAWLQELDVEDQTVTLRGTAQHATALLKTLSASPLFSNVQFEAPLTQGFSGNGQQFDIIMTRN